LQDDRIRYAGQAVAVVIARDWQAAREGAAMREVDKVPDATPIAARLAEAGARLAHPPSGRDRAGSALQGAGGPRHRAVAARR
jgi:CO/xanthine dehydrogenase Mo-binding subunit